jgi:hypothetical protein
MNKKPVYTDFLNSQWKPAPMFYAFKPNVRPYLLPRNRGTLPMPKSGHIQFGEVAAIAKAEFNPLPHRPALQLPGKIFNTIPAPQQKFLNAATVKLINSGKVKAVFKNGEKLNPLSMPIVSQMENSNMKLISLEMIKNAVMGLKKDAALGTEQQQLQAKSSYDNLIVAYSALVSRKDDNPENVKKIIAQYEKEMIAIYGPSIRKPVKEDVLSDIVFQIQRATSTLVELYEMIDSKKIGLPQVELEGEKEVEEEPEEEAEGEPKVGGEDEAKAPDPRTPEEQQLDNILSEYIDKGSEKEFIGNKINNDPKILGKLLIRLGDTWNDKNLVTSKMLLNISSKIIKKYDKIKDISELPIVIPSAEELNDEDTRYQFMDRVSDMFGFVVAPKVAPTVGAPTVSAEGISQQWYARHAASGFKKQDIFDDLHTYFEDRKYSVEDIENIIQECLNKLTAKEQKALYYANVDDSDKYDFRKQDEREAFLAALKEYVITPAAKLNDTSHTMKLAKAQQQQQAGPGRKRKSRKRPVIKSVKKLSPNINDAIMRLLKS